MYTLIHTPGQVDSLRTERLLLRPLTLEDAPAYWPLVSDAEVLRHTGERPCESLQQVRELLRDKPLTDYAARGHGRLAAVTRHDGRLVGWCGLKYLAELDEVDLGYRFVREVWGQGLATEAGAAVLHHGFHTLALQRVIGLVEPTNLASARVLRKLGLAFERTLMLPAHADEIHLYATAAGPA